GELAMQLRRHPHQELPRVGPIADGYRRSLAARQHVLQDVLDQRPDPDECFVLLLRYPRQRGKLGDGAHEGGVLRRPAHAIRVVLGVRHARSPSTLSIAASTCRTWYALALPPLFWMFTRGSPRHGIRYTRCEPPRWRGSPK